MLTLRVRQETMRHIVPWTELMHCDEDPGQLLMMRVTLLSEFKNQTAQDLEDGPRRDGHGALNPPRRADA
jgi:hypothetical protein